MQILLRKWNDKFYVWKDATYKNGNFYCNGCRINENYIIAVKDDERKDHVVCANCGQVIKNTPESIEEHFASQEAQRNCFKCSHLRKGNVEHIKADFTKNEYGKFVVTESYNAQLKCGRSWYNSPDIDSSATKELCIFYQCRNAGVKPIKDVFTQYPGLFDKHITVDALNAHKFEHEHYANGYFEYDLKCRNTVKACVNELGIVDHFIVKHRGYRFIAYYSAKYDKLFFCNDGSSYDEEMPYHMSESKYNQAKAKISALYKEEED